MSNDRIWFVVNRVAGRDLIVAGIAVITSAVAVFWSAKESTQRRRQ